MLHMKNEVNTARRDASGRGLIRTGRSRRMRYTIAKCAASMLRSGLHRHELRKVSTRSNTVRGRVQGLVGQEIDTTNGRAVGRKTKMDTS